jgi:hypothetical protein
MIQNTQLVELIRIALELIPAGEYLAEFNARNNITYGPSWEGPERRFGTMEVEVVTHDHSRMENTYLLVKVGDRHKLKFMGKERVA